MLFSAGDEFQGSLFYTRYKSEIVANFMNDMCFDVVGTGKGQDLLLDAVVERAGPTGKAVLYVRGEQGVSRRELFDAAPPLLAELAPAPAFAL